MADSFTGNLNLRKPEVGAANNTWGGTAGLNADLDLLDSIFQSNGLSPVAPVTGPLANVPGVGLRVGIGYTLNVEGTALFKDHTDVTKVGTLDSSLITTATTRTLQFPDENGIIATVGVIQRAVPPGTVFSGYYGNTPPTGFIFLDGRTIGDATSSATNRANADTVNLFTLMWNLGAGVLPSRGLTTAAADFAAHKQVVLPNHSGRVMAGRDNLSGTAANIMPGANTVGVLGGSNLSSTGNIHSTGNNAINFGNLAFSQSTGRVLSGSSAAQAGSGAPNLATVNDQVTVTGFTPVNGNFGIAVDGSSASFNIVQPTIAVDVIIAL